MFHKLYGLCVRKYIYTHKQPVTGRFVKHLQLMSSLLFRLGDAESFLNYLYFYFIVYFIVIILR